jgi:transposase-like protein
MAIRYGPIETDEDGYALVHVIDADHLLHFYARPFLEGDRIAFADVRVIAYHGSAVTRETLRAVPVGAALSWANSPAGREQLRGHRLVVPADRLNALAEAIEEAVEDADPLPKRRPSLRLAGAHDRRKPKAFYERLATAYRWLRERDGSRRPVMEIAEANDVPRTTAHRWIKEARRRGLLGPGTSGRAGE